MWEDPRHACHIITPDPPQGPDIAEASPGRRSGEGGGERGRERSGHRLTVLSKCAFDGDSEALGLKGHVSWTGLPRPHAAHPGRERAAAVNSRPLELTVRSPRQALSGTLRDPGTVPRETSPSPPCPGLETLGPSEGPFPSHLLRPSREA